MPGGGKAEGKDRVGGMVVAGSLALFRCSELVIFPIRKQAASTAEMTASKPALLCGRSFFWLEAVLPACMMRASVMVIPTCSRCGKVIPSEDVNVANDVAYCRACNLSL